MPGKYTPTTEDVRAAYYSHPGNRDWEAPRAAAFDRWLAEHVRLAQEQAWNEGWARAMVRIEVDGEVQPESNPYTQGDKQA